MITENHSKIIRC